MTALTALEEHLRSLRGAGHKALAVYLTGGYPDPASFTALMRAAADGGADVVEVGIPFSDPVIDGPVIQAASQAALERGTTPMAVLDAACAAEVPVPVVAMTYANPVWRVGWERFASTLAARGLAGAIVPDLPLEESAPWEEAAGAAGVAAVLLAPPNASDGRLSHIAERSTGFVYGMSLMGVTGERGDVSQVAVAHGDRLRAVTDRPVLIGIGISTPAQAAATAAHADGIIVGSVLVRAVLEGGGPDEVAGLVSSLKQAMQDEQAEVVR